MYWYRHITYNVCALNIRDSSYSFISISTIKTKYLNKNNDYRKQ